MGEDDAFGIAGGAGGEENLQRGLVRKTWGPRPFASGRIADPVFKGKGGDGDRTCAASLQGEGVADSEFGVDVGGDTFRKIVEPSASSGPARTP